MLGVEELVKGIVACSLRFDKISGKTSHTISYFGVILALRLCSCLAWSKKG